MKANLTNASKFLSYVLRHRPDEIGIQLDAQGWVDVDALITAANAAGQSLTRELVEQVVATSDKKRFALSDDGRRIRANQGHSVGVDLGLAPVTPPELLYHGTGEKSVDSIRRTGLEKRSRQHVHLSLDVATATKVGERHGRPVILTVRSGEMHRHGHVFFLSENGVWLTDVVPVTFIDFPA